MKGFILAAGFGERLRPLTEIYPKPLLPVWNIPSLLFPLLQMRTAGIRQVCINTHYKSEAIIAFIRSLQMDMEIVISVEETILGTGGGLKKCADFFGNDDILLMNADIIADVNLFELINIFSKRRQGGTLLLYQTPDANSIGWVGVQGDQVVDFRNLRGTEIKTDFIYTGIGIFSSSILQHLCAGFSSIVTTGFTGLIETTGLNWHLHQRHWQDIGTWEAYTSLNLHGYRPFAEFVKKIRWQWGNGSRSGLPWPSPYIEFYEDKKKDLHIQNCIIDDIHALPDHCLVENSLIWQQKQVEIPPILRNAVLMQSSLFSLQGNSYRENRNEDN